MEIELKIFIYWLALTSLFYIVSRLAHVYSGDQIQWKYWKYDNAFGMIHAALWGVGLFVIGCYLLIQVTEWWFDK